MSKNLTKSGKKLLKNGNLPNFSATKTKSRFLIFDTKMAFNYLWLIFIKIPIF